tara:strand:- start:2673 stop:3095 length:423 start_codon:yes stop_codon:yes gene_type:complete
MESKKQVQITVALAVIQDEEGKILLQKRNSPKQPEAHGKWEFPGGKIEFGESLEEAAKREVKEETGCEVEIGDIIPWIQVNYWELEEKKLQVFAIGFKAVIKSGTPAPSHREVSEIGWFTKEEAADLETIPGIPKYIELL